MAALDNAPRLRHMFSMRGTQIEALTGIRGWLALWVFTLHAASYFPHSSLAKTAFAGNGYLGVDAFFMLSGLVLFHVHGRDMQSLSLRNSGDFLLLRLARIYPLHIFMFGLFLAYVASLLLTSHQPDPTTYSLPAAVAQLTLTQAWFGYSGSWNFVSWTISAEWAMYLLFPFFAWIASRVQPCVFFALASTAFVLFELAYGFSTPNTVYRVLPEFLLGIGLCLLPAASARRAQILTCTALLLLGSATLLHSNTLLAVGGLALLLYALRTEQTWVGRALSTRLCIWFGEISYALYMCHVFVLKFAHNLVPRFWPQDIGVTMCLCLSLAMAAFSYHFIETPARHWIRSFRQPAAA